MPEGNFRFISQAARIADRLEPHVASERQRPSDGIRRGPTRTNNKLPIDINAASAIDELDRDVLQDLAIHKAARETLDGDSPDIRFPDRQAGARLLVELLNEDQGPEPLTTRTVVAFRRHLAVLMCALADAEDESRMRCPQDHIAAEGIPGRTVVPAHLLEHDRAGQLICVHPDCDDIPGVPRVLNLIDEVLLADPNRLVTLEEVAVLLGISEAAAKRRIQRARKAGHDLPVVDTRTSPKGQKQNLHQLAALAKVNSIGRDLGAGIAEWPNKRLRRRRPNPGT